ncbi:MAG: trehalose utilization protein ThuA [Planctomycetaceae bacterium]|nr:trehalose utilization protein ThuA [Planctomycetaceae bacterium]
MNPTPLRVTVWNEFVHEQEHERVRAIYPEGIHATIKTGLEQQLQGSVIVKTATLQQSEHGLTEELLDETDVLLWWGHASHDQVADEIVDRVHRRVLNGMGLIPLHSAHLSKIFVKLMGTSCMLRWRDAGERERLWIVNPAHEIVDGIEGECFELPSTEMYGEYFDIPAPDELILISWFAGGEVFRSGMTFRRGKGRIFYFRPGHETFPIYHQPIVQRILANGVCWAAPRGATYFGDGRHIPKTLEVISSTDESDPALHKRP